MTNEQRTNTSSASARTGARADDVTAHEQAQYATPALPSLPCPALPTQPKNKNQTPHSSPARTYGSADTREEPPALALPDEDEPWLVGYQIDRINATVKLLGFKPPVTETLRSKRWTTLIPGEGWVIPARYLAHTERLLAGANVDLFDIDGAPTPGQNNHSREAELAHTCDVLAELHAARDAHDHTAAHRHYLEATRLVAARLAELHPEPEEVAS